jgi:transcription-repair coupling factor (superfamily II helicase)
MGLGLATAGIEYYLPLFFDETSTVFDYLGTQAVMVLHGELERAFEHFWHDTNERYKLACGDPDRPVLPPHSLFLSSEEFYLKAKPYAQLALRPPVAHSTDVSTQDLGQPPSNEALGGEGSTQEHTQASWSQALPDLRVQRGHEDPLSLLKRHAQRSPHRLLLLAESEGRRQSLLDFLLIIA